MVEEKETLPETVVKGVIEGAIEVVMLPLNVLEKMFPLKK